MTRGHILREKGVRQQHHRGARMRPTGRAEKVVIEAHPTSMTCNPGRAPCRWCRNGSALEAEHRWWQHRGGRGDGRGGGVGEEHRR
jgi:hypothetical protein